MLALYLYFLERLKAVDYKQCCGTVTVGTVTF
jgi:hypothetical protein